MPCCFFSYCYIMYCVLWKWKCPKYVLYSPKRSIIPHVCPFPCVYVCEFVHAWICMHVCRCTRLCRAAVTAANMSGGSSPGPFVPLTLWTTCQPAGRESRVARSGQWAGELGALLAWHHNTHWQQSCSWHSHPSWHLQCQGKTNSWNKLLLTNEVFHSAFLVLFKIATEGSSEGMSFFLQATSTSVGFGLCSIRGWVLLCEKQFNWSCLV